MAGLEVEATPRANGHAAIQALAAAPPSVRAILAPLAAIIVGTFMAILDTTVVNVALPHLGRVFAVDLTLLQWVITGYTLAQAGVVPLAGWLSDRVGAKRVYLTALVLFTLGSALCALAPTGESLVAFRALQGMGGGMLMPVGMAFVYRMAPPERRGAVMGAFGFPVLLAPALGPILSGALIQYADWRLIFLINIPVGAAALALGLRTLPRLEAQAAPGALDVPGAVLGPLAFVALTYGIAQSYAAGWTAATTLAGFTVGAVALVAFVLRELAVREPLLELRVMGSGLFRRAILAQWLAGLGMFGTMFLIPLFLQQVRGYSPFETGLATLPQAVMAAIFMQVGGRLFDRMGARFPVPVGLALVTAAMLWLSTISPATSTTDLIAPLAIWGAGMGFAMMALNTYLLNSAPPGLVSRVTSLVNALFSVVISLGVAGSANILQSRTASHVAELGPGATAATLGFDDTFLVAASIAAVAALVALTLRRPAVPSVHPPADEANGRRVEVGAMS